MRHGNRISEQTPGMDTHSSFPGRHHDYHDDPKAKMSAKGAKAPNVHSERFTRPLGTWDSLLA